MEVIKAIQIILNPEERAETEYYPKAEADAVIARLEAEVDRLNKDIDGLKEIIDNTAEQLNPIMTDLLGFGGAVLSDSNRQFLNSFFNFIEDDTGISEEIIAKELGRKGVDVPKLLKRTDDLIKEMKTKQALNGGR